MTATDDEAGALIRRLGLVPHPEGGHYRETFRDPEGMAGRAWSSAIYFLLRAGEISRWHRVDAAEVWHWYAGAPLLLRVTGTEGLREVRLGNDIAGGFLPQFAVPARAWQSAQSLGAYSLAGCTVAPGFDFAGFELASDAFDPGA